MPNSREIRNRIRSVKNTGKITKTMEMVSVTKSARAMNAIKASRPYCLRIADLFAGLGSAAAGSPLLKDNGCPRKVMVLVTANRGLCGGYNANIVRLGLRSAEQGTQFVVLGKKGATALRFGGIQPREVNTSIRDIPRFEDGQDIVNRLIQEYAAGKVGAVDVVYTKFLSAGSQKATVERLLPFPVPQAEAGKPASTAEIEPDAEALLAVLAPKAVRSVFFRMLLDSAASEQLARQIAMRSAADNAGEMVRLLTQSYNRARQSQITTEISEIVGGAEALN